MIVREPGARLPAPIEASVVRKMEVDEHFQALVRTLWCAPDSGDPPPRTLGLTSCLPGEGVTTTALNLAVGAAQAGLGGVLLVDANTLDPALDELFDTPSHVGLADALAGIAAPLECVRETCFDRLSVMPAGSVAARAAVGCDPVLLREVFETLARHFDIVVVDLPPANELTTCFTLAGRLDAVLLVLQTERVDRQVAYRVRQHLAATGTRMLGAVLNRWRERWPRWLRPRF